MKTLYLIRHGEAEPAHLAKSDKQRALTLAGQDEVRSLTQRMSKQLAMPDLFLVSDAHRTLQTAEIIQVHWPCEALSLKILPLLYDNDYQSVFAYLQKIHHAHDTVAVCGHNPTLSLLTHFFLGEDYRLGTAHCVAMQFDIERWKGLFYHAGQKIAIFDTL